MATEDKSLWIIHNGEIYNYQEIRSELEGKGHRFRSDTDTEVILAAYREWGPDCVARFNGMWAFIIYDVNRQRLFVSRDRFGIKPLYYAQHNGCIFFASEIKGLLAAGIPRDVNDGIVFDYLIRGYNDHTDETFFKHIHSFPACHNAVIDTDGKTSYTQYWHIDPTPHPAGCIDDIETATEEFRDILVDSIRLRLISDVPVGTCLSGGLDSSSIVATIGSILKTRGGGDARLSRALGPQQRAFSSCYSDVSADESRFSKIAAEAVGAKRHTVYPTGEELWRDIDHFITVQDEPFASTSMYAQYRVMKLVKETDVTVLLDGQGSDEILAGYPGYRGRWLAQLLSSGRFPTALKELAGRGMGPGERSIALQGMLFYLLPLSGIRASTTSDQLGLNVDFMNTHRERLSALDDMGSVKNLADQLRMDTFRRSIPALLRYEDRNSMAFSLESRVPFLDYRLVEKAFSLPNDLKIHNGYTKWILRNAMNSRLPDEITWRKDKKGFTTPERAWMLNGADMLRDAIQGDSALNDYLDSAVARKHLEKFLSSESGGERRIWRWANLSLWLTSLHRWQ
jgi:asparagine synthase (glutamine-hydrolysing)